MLSEIELRKLLLRRIEACWESCNSSHINHVDGQIRALIAVLNDGELPPASKRLETYLKAAGIKFRKLDNGEIEYDDSLISGIAWED